MIRPNGVTLGLFLGALLVLTGLATIIPMLPEAEAATNTISTNTDVDSLTVNPGDTLIVNSGVMLGANSITNYGTIINNGSIYDGEQLTNTGTITNNGRLIVAGAALNDAGIINSYGSLWYEGQRDPGFLNSHGGMINIKQGTLLFTRGGSWAPHDMINDKDSVIDNFGSANETGYGGMSVVNNGTLYNECNATFTIPVSGNPVIDKCVAPTANTLTINSSDTHGSPISGLWTTIRSSDGTLLKSGFTPMSFAGISGSSYKVSVANYDGKIFSKWQDDNSTSKTRTITLTSNATLTAIYDIGDALRGFTSLTYTGTDVQPDLTVNALTTNDNKTLHMWTIIDPQSTNSSGTTYKVYASNYQDKVFDHWSDNGSKERIRTITIGQASSITAYYQVTPSSTTTQSVSFAQKTVEEQPGVSRSTVGVDTTFACGDFTSTKSFFTFSATETGSTLTGGYSLVTDPPYDGESDKGTATGLLVTSTNFRLETTWDKVSASPLSFVESCNPVPSTVVIEGPCGNDVTVAFTAANGASGTFRGNVACTT